MIKKIFLFSKVFLLFAFAMPFLGFSQTVGVFYDNANEQMKFAAADVKTALEAKSLTVEMLPLSSLSVNYANDKVVIALATNTAVTSLLTNQGGTIPTGLGEQAYNLSTTTSPKLSYWVLGGDINGAMYGGLQIAENVKFKGFSGNYNSQESPKILQRGVKLNLPFDVVSPTYPYATKGTSTENSIQHTWDINFWKTWFDEMARNRFNLISVWNNHPFTSMVQLNDYPNTYIQNVTGYNGFKKTMTLQQKIDFWKEVMQLAHNRGFEFMLFTWNVWLNNAAGQYGLTNDAVTTTNSDYVYKSMSELLKLYPNLDGIGLTNGEKTSTEDYLWKAYGKAVYDNLKINTNRKFRVIVRYYFTSPGKLVDSPGAFKPLLTLPNVKFNMSFKYSNAHMYSMPVPGYLDASKEAQLRKYNMKTFLTVRNDDFYYNSWGDPVYARAYFKGMYDRDVFTGFYIGSDGYSPTRDFLSKYSPYKGKLEVERQWYTNMLLGRLSYNPTTSDDIFKNYLNQRFPTVSSSDLFDAWSKASRGVQKTNILIHDDYDVDYKWYPEMCSNTQKSPDGFVTIDDFGIAIPGLGSTYASIKNTAAGTLGGLRSAIDVAKEIETDAKSALNTVNSFSTSDPNTELGVTIRNVKTNAYLSLYYANKVLGSVYKLQKKTPEMRTALAQAYCWWKKYTNLMEQMYNGQNNQRTVDIKDWHMYDAAVLKEYTANGGVGTPALDCEGPSTCTVTAITNGCAGGIVDITGSNNCGGSVTLTAKPAVNCNFVNFTDGTTTWTTNPLTVSVTSNKQYTANFSGAIQAPVADFTSNTTSVLVGGTVNFTDSSTNTPTSWSWSFQGGTPATSTAQKPSVRYDTAGVYDVTLTSTNATGSSTKTKTKVIIVSAISLAPVADFTSDANSITSGGTVNFTDSSANTPTSWSWSFPGGTPATSTAQKPSVKYDTAGAYDVTLTATNATGSNTKTKAKLIVVSTVNLAPIADFTSNVNNITSGGTVNFTDSSVNTPTSWSWSFPGGTPSTSTAQKPSVKYDTAGEYDVTLTSTNATGSNTKAKAKYVVVSKPAANVSSLTGWVAGTNIPKVAGSNRLLVVMVMGESSVDLSATSVTYGGKAMTEQTDRMYFVTGSRNYAAIFTLNEAGVNLASNGTIVVNWNKTPDSGFNIYSTILTNVDQQIPVSITGNTALTGTVVTVPGLATASGDMVVMCGSTGGNVNQTFNNGFLKQFESNSTWGDAVGGSKIGNGQNETPSFTQSSSGRMVICAMVVKKAGSQSARISTDKLENASENIFEIYPNPTSGILNINFPNSDMSREIQIINTLGQKVHSVTTHNNHITIDVKSLNLKEFFIVKVIAEDGVTSHKVLVK